jgi:hypothetical protein
VGVTLHREMDDSAHGKGGIAYRANSRHPARGSDDALNAKGNFRFERELRQWRSGYVLDLRLKR